MATYGPLTRHDGPIVTDHDGQVIQNLDIYVDSGPAVVLDNNNVVLENCRIHYNDAHTSGDAMGVLAKNASGITIQNVEVINAGAPASGPETNPNHYNIMAENATNLHITDATLRDGSTGVYLLNSPGAVLQGIEGYDFHGPFPRGQLVQFNQSPNSSLSDFYVHNDPKVAFTEDNVSVYQSDNVTIQRGVIDGNNSPSGQGVIFEGSDNGTVSHVDTIHMGNGAFASYGNNNTFDYTRSFDNIAADQGRGAPLSGAVIWTLNGDGNTVSHSSYENPAVPNNIVYDYHNGTNSVNLTKVTNAAPQTHWANDLHWITDPGQSGTDPGTTAGNSGSGATAGGTDPGQSGTDPGTTTGNSGSGATAGGTDPGHSGTDPGTTTGNSGSGATAGGTDPGHSGTDPGTTTGNSGSGATAGGTDPGHSGTDPGTTTGNSGSGATAGGTDPGHSGTDPGTTTGNSSSGATAGGTDPGHSGTDPGTTTGNSGSGATAGGTDPGHSGTDPGTTTGNSGSGATAGGTDPGHSGTDPGTTTGNSGTDTAGNDTPQVHFEHGDHGANDLFGSAVDDVMLALRGNDQLAGGDGNDHLFGGGGNDILFGGAGNDEIHGGAGSDIIKGDAGADLIDGGSGKDVLLLSGTIDDYTTEVRGHSVRFTNAAGETDVVRGVEQFHFDDGATYAVTEHALVQTNHTDGLDALLAKAGAWDALQAQHAEGAQHSNTGLAEITELDLASGAKPAAITPDPNPGTAVESVDASAHVDHFTGLTAHDNDHHHIFG